MVFLQAILFARTNNIEKIIMPQQQNWHIKIKCASCNEKFNKDVIFNKFQEHQLTKQHGSANFIAKCKNCQRTGSIRIDGKSPYEVKPNEDGIIKSCIVIFECRGLDIESVQLGNSFSIKVANSPTIFHHADFTDLWAQYDEVISQLAQSEDMKIQVRIVK